MDKKEQEERRLINEINEKKFKNNVKYLMEHSGALTVILTTFVGISATLFKFVVYVLDCGKMDHWGVDHVYINTSSDEGFIFEILWNITWIFIYFIICSMLYKTWMKKDKILKKFLRICVEYTFIMLLFGGIIQYREKDIVFYEILRPDVFWMIALVVAILLIPGMVTVIYIHQDQKAEQKKPLHGIYMHKLFNLKSIVFLFGGVLVEIVLIYVGGRGITQSKSSFKIINNTEAVIYENADIYIVSPCEIDETNNIVIFNHTQKIIDKKNVTTEQQRFEKVSLGKVAMTK